MNEKIIDELIADFDFNRVLKCMNVLEWTWGDKRPTIPEMKKKARELLIRVSTGEFSQCCSGGFCASVDGNHKLSLWFVIEESREWSI